MGNLAFVFGPLDLGGDPSCVWNNWFDLASQFLLVAISAFNFSLQPLLSNCSWDFT